MLFEQTFKNISRFREIVQAFVKYGYGDMVLHTPLRKLLTRSMLEKWQRDAIDEEGYTRWELIRMLVEELGPTFIKGAQVMSNRIDMIPMELAEEFQKLQSEVPPFDFELLKSIIEEDTGESLEQIFSYFDRKPLGAASIGQVHRARLKNGEDVVVKVRRPGVKEQVRTDLQIIRSICNIADAQFQKQGIFNALDFVDTFERTIMHEMNYTHEARNMNSFRGFYKKYNNFYVPKAFKEYQSERVLVMEFVDGTKITNVAKLESWGLKPQKLAEQGIAIYLLQIFEFGYFHADPHPGNIIITEKGQICLIDFGMVGRLTKHEKFAFANLLIGMAEQNPQKMARNFKRLSIDPEIDSMRQFEADCFEIIEDYTSSELSEISIADFAISFQKILKKYRLRVPGNVMVIMRALTILEGIGRTIHPSFNTYSFIRPYGAKILKELYSPKNILDHSLNYLSQLSAFMDKFPADMSDTMHQLRKGRLKIRHEHLGYEPGVEMMGRAINRLGLAVIVLGLLVSAALLRGAELQEYGEPGKTSQLLFVFSIILTVRFVWLAYRNK